MLVFDDSGVGFIVTGVVNHGVALVVGGVLHAGLEGDGSPVELAKTIVEILVKLTCINEIAGNLFPCFLDRLRREIRQIYSKLSKILNGLICYGGKEIGAC